MNRHSSCLRLPRIFAAGVVILLVGAITWQFFQLQHAHQRRITLRTHYDAADYQAALQLGMELLRQQPEDQEILAITGLSAASLGHREQALKYLSRLRFQRIPDHHVYEGWMETATIHTDTGQLTDAVTQLQAVLNINKTDVLAIRRLAQIRLGVGDQQRSRALLNQLVTLGHASPHELMTLAAGGQDLWSFDRIERLRHITPQDPLLIQAHARRLIRHNRTADALDLLNQALAKHPHNSALLLLRLELDTDGEHNWTPLADADDSTSLWLFLARQVESTDLRRGTGYVHRAVSLSPFDARAISQQARLRSHQGDEDGANGCYFRSSQLQELAELCRQRDAIGSAAAERCVVLLREMYRLPEAIAWCRAELQIDSQSDWARTALNDLLEEQMRVRTSLQPPAPAYAALSVQDAIHHLIELRATASLEADSNHPASNVGHLQFEDVADSTGLHVSFYNGAQATEQRRRMHEFTGGGIGVLDLDGDDWPDLIFPQGSDDPTGRQSPQTAPADQLLRNLRGTGFVDVSQVAGITESDFGQGVAVGDVNNDGFDDIYIANTAHNTLWLNQGDGTFVRDQHRQDPGVWTISAAVADINGDSVPDLYDVNYVGGDQVFTQVCDHEGEERVCGPTDFPAEPDLVHFGSKDGTFRPLELTEDITNGPGRGMGVVAGDLLGDSRVQLLVANDESANFFLEYIDNRIRNTALLRGLATGSDGELQGSMGIAAGHVSSRQRTDLFITNYYAEANCLHLQTADGFFPDMITQQRLEQPGRPVLGFGTQFLDADADGDDDLFVANGHLDDFRHLQIPYHMRPQLFENMGNHFAERLPAASDYLTTPVLGRAVARLDWNRDGRMDLCVTHLDRPVALLENHTIPAERSLMLSYVGTAQSRDAVGTILTMTPTGNLSNGDAEEQATFSVLAGDGYACTNERLQQLVVDRDTQQITVSDGQHAVHIQVDDGESIHWRIVEGRPHAWRIPR